MCGIIGYIGPCDTTDILLNGLRRFEYRGYDSAGAAVTSALALPTPAGRRTARRPTPTRIRIRVSFCTDLPRRGGAAIVLPVMEVTSCARLLNHF